jgi:hypothetical protein
MEPELAKSCARSFLPGGYGDAASCRMEIVRSTIQHALWLWTRPKLRKKLGSNGLLRSVMIEAHVAH